MPPLLLRERLTGKPPTLLWPDRRSPRRSVRGDGTDERRSPRLAD
jgi:hypothetical protein